MPHLHDMEELISSIEDNQVKDYMKEAMSCYMANAYRACIVLTYIALFDDIVKKLGELGKVNKKAKKIHDDAQNKINEQDVYENFLIEQLASNSLIPKLDTSFLDILRQLRNKSAHPSGHSASAEEARFVFYEAINRFLSKPILTTTQLVDDILARLDQSNFFPSLNIKNISIIVKKEIVNIHHEALPYLISQLLNKYSNNNSTISKNAGFFLTGLARLKEPEASKYIKKYVIDDKCSDPKYSRLILRMISADGSLVEGLDSIAYDRLRVVITERLDTVDSSLDHTKLSHPSKTLCSILKDSNEKLLIKHFKSQLTELFSKYIFSIIFVSHMSNHSEVINLYLKEACKQAGSNDFKVSNNFSDNIADVDSYLSESLSGAQAFLIIANIFKAAENKAWMPQSLRNSGFSSIPQIKNIVVDYIQSDRTAAKAKYKRVTGSEENFDDLIDKYLLSHQN